ncbi:MAG: hypothetical protein WD846_01360 [Patescibacteria group bacterium]
MATVAPMKPNQKELRWAKRIVDRDEHAIIGIDNALAHGVTPGALGLTPEVLHEARVQYVRYALMKRLFDDKKDFLHSRPALYLALEVVRPEEVSVQKEHLLILAAAVRRVNESFSDRKVAAHRGIIKRAVANSRPADT